MIYYDLASKLTAVLDHPNSKYFIVVLVDISNPGTKQRQVL